MKKTEPQPIGDIINEVFRRSGHQADADRYRALTNWVNVVGPGINALTTRRYVTEAGAIHVYISSAAVKADLMFMRRSLLDSLNEYAGAPGVITELIIH
ncbi:MAG: DUF721 domain-containing protein [Muribaculaceae bacterium]|nr:DUF721 domain-containing protein [Muribaculaceae bacterium]MDE7335657.1 DUF721 domain-containing protein [Muribaculaceae bacterium]